MVTNVLDLIIRNAVTGPKIVRTVKPRMLHMTERARTVNEGENSAYGMFLDKPIGKRQLGRPKMRWEDNVEINLDTCIKGRRDGIQS
jgi:hypothetical protein